MDSLHVTVTGWPLYPQKVSFSADPALLTTSHPPAIQEDGTWSLQIPPRTNSIPDLASDAYSPPAGGPSSPLGPQACPCVSQAHLEPSSFLSDPHPQPQSHPLFLSQALVPSQGDGVWGGKPAPQEPAPPDNVLLWVTTPLALRAPWSLGLGWGDDE